MTSSLNGVRGRRAPGWPVALAGACLLAFGASATPPNYSIDILPPSPLALWSAYDLGPQGQVVGRTYNLGANPPQSKGFVWHNGSFTLLDGPGGEVMTEANCMDENGVVYGGYIDRRFDPLLLKRLPCRWVNGVPEAYANNQFVNSSTIFGCSPTTGVAVGWAKPYEPFTPGWRGEFGYPIEWDFEHSDPVRAFVWKEGQGQVLTRGVGVGDDRVQDINDSGQASITLGSFDEVGGAAIYDPEFGLARLPDLGAGGSLAMGINEDGDIVGWTKVSGHIDHPVLWRDGQCIDLGLIPGFVEGRAWDINDSGTIVGTLGTQVFEFGVIPAGGFVRIDGVMYNLATRIPGGSGFTIKDALAINESGQILVLGTVSPQAADRYAVLTPIP